jgi:sucrose-phosphate synthase
MAKSGIYIQLFSIHGLVRGHSLELGRDADTGGQVKYVVELAKCLADQPEVGHVDLVTRLIDDKTVSATYSTSIESLANKARIVRIQCGGRKYIRKELLWPHLDEMVDKTLKFIKTSGRIPDVFHGHYADGGYVARQLASIFGVPFIFTGHSMGRHKKDKLLAEAMSPEEVNRRYRIDHRIRVEENVIKEAERVVVSTNHEINKQYSLYENFASGRYEVIPPGIDVDIFYPYYNARLDENTADEACRQARMVLLHELQRFWVEPRKPFILALCRPDQRKNIAGLITSYGENHDLQAIANLAVFAGIRKDISCMEENERTVLTEMLLLMDRYDLYGHLAIPKKHDFSIEVPELYRLCADSRGVFVNPALIEPFGLTLIEAASCGLPIIATSDGGPADIVRNCENGILIDPTNTDEIASSCKKILVDKELWETFSSNGINGVRKHYSWQSHCTSTIKMLHNIIREMPTVDASTSQKPLAFGQRLTRASRLLITDIDNTLIGDDASLQKLIGLLAQHEKYICWGVATGRSYEMVREALTEHGVPDPHILICSVGTEIYYGPDFVLDTGWQQHLAYQWKPDLVREVISGLDFLELQENESQCRYKISCYVDMEKNPDLVAKVHQALQARKVRYNLVLSLGQYLDIIPYRASKGKAVRYLSYKWEMPLNHMMVCGDSGKDEEMLRGDTCSVIVGNYDHELESLRGMRNTYFSDQDYAAGILDGLRHFDFFAEAGNA